jgi:hypothetical protein
MENLFHCPTPRNVAMPANVRVRAAADIGRRPRASKECSCPAHMKQASRSATTRCLFGGIEANRLDRSHRRLSIWCNLPALDRPVGSLRSARLQTSVNSHMAERWQRAVRRCLSGDLTISPTANQDERHRANERFLEAGRSDGRVPQSGPPSPTDARCRSRRPNTSPKARALTCSTAPL